MSMKRCKLIPRALVVLGMLFGVFLVNPAVHAGGAQVLMPVEDTGAPEGSRISEQRINRLEKMVSDYKEKMKAKSTEQKQEQSPQDDPNL
ncbi:MAG: hypothetical protein ACR2RB_02585 [Gammaproteobacteria bacterium]